MISSKAYRERMAKLKPNVYQQGKLVDRFDPSITGGIDVIASTYDFAYDPELNGIGVAIIGGTDIECFPVRSDGYSKRIIRPCVRQGNGL